MDSFWKKTLVAGSLSAAAAGAYFYLRGRPRALAEADRRSDSPLLPIVADFIDPEVADFAISRLEHMRSAPVVVLHTFGGEVVSCVRVANALRDTSATAIIPYRATSGGTLIALSSARVEMGRNAALSAVDPVRRDGRRSKHLRKPEDQEYTSSIRTFVEQDLGRHLSRKDVADALSVFLGEGRPHGWPIYAGDLKTLGFAVGTADPRWSELVDALVTEQERRSENCVIIR